MCWAHTGGQGWELEDNIMGGDFFPSLRDFRAGDWTQLVRFGEQALVPSETSCWLPVFIFKQMWGLVGFVIVVLSFYQTFLENSGRRMASIRIRSVSKIKGCSLHPSSGSCRDSGQQVFVSCVCQLSATVRKHLYNQLPRKKGLFWPVDAKVHGCLALIWSL